MTKREALEYWADRWKDEEQHHSPESRDWYIAGYYCYLKGSQRIVGKWLSWNEKLAQAWLMGWDDAYGDWDGTY